MKKILALALTFIMVLSTMPMMMASAEDTYTYKTVFDAETSDIANVIGDNMTPSIIDSELSGGTKVLQAKRTATYNGCYTKFTDDFRSYAKDAIGLRMWVAGDSVAIDNSKNFSFGLQASNGTVYKIDQQNQNRWAPTAEGDVYTVMFSDLSELYPAGSHFNASYYGTSASTLLTEEFLGRMTGVCVGRSANSAEDNTTMPTYYIDNVELIFPANHTFAPLEYKASFVSTETATLASEVEIITANPDDNDSLVLPSATLADGEFAGWVTEADPATVLPAGTTVYITGDTTYYAVSTPRTPGVAPAAPTATEVLGTQVTLASMGAGYEYKVDDGEWQTSNVFSDLTRNATYTFYARTTPTLAYDYSPASEGLEITTPEIYVFRPGLGETTITAENCTTSTTGVNDTGINTTGLIIPPVDNAVCTFGLTGLTPGYYSLVVASRNTSGRSAFAMTAKDETGAVQNLGLMDFQDMTYLNSGATYQCDTPVATQILVKSGSTLDLTYTMDTKRTSTWGAVITTFTLTKVSDEVPSGFKASFASTETAVLASEVSDIDSNTDDTDSVVLPSATLTEGEFGGWVTEVDPSTVIPAGTKVYLLADTTYYAVSSPRTPGAVPAAPTASEITPTQITLTPMGSGYEYKMGDGSWQSSNVFVGLTSDTSYTFYTRTIANVAYDYSPSSAGLEVKTYIVYSYNVRNGEAANIALENCTQTTYSGKDSGKDVSYYMYSAAADSAMTFSFDGLAPGYYTLTIGHRFYTNRSKYAITANDETGEAQSLGSIDFNSSAYVVSGFTNHCEVPIETQILVKSGSTVDVKLSMEVLGSGSIGTYINKFIFTKVGEYTPVATPVPVTDERASIRLGTVNGIRFTSTVDTSAIPADAQTVTYGTLIGAENLIGDELTIDDVASGAARDVKYEADLINGNTFVGSIVSLRDSTTSNPTTGNLARNFVGRGYVCVDGVYYYSQTTCTRSIAQIATSYIADPDSGYSNLTDDVKALVDKWAAAYDPAA